MISSFSTSAQTGRQTDTHTHTDRRKTVSALLSIPGMKLVTVHMQNKTSGILVSSFIRDIGPLSANIMSYNIPTELTEHLHSRI